MGTMAWSRFDPSPAAVGVVGGGALVGVLLGAAIGMSAASALALVAMPAAVLAVWRFPGVLFALYLAIPFYKGAIDAVLPVDLTLALAVLALIAAMPVIAHLATARRAIVLWLLLAAVVVIGGLLAPSRADGLAIAASFLALITGAGLVAIRVAVSPTARRQLVATLVAIGLLSALLTVAGRDQASTLTRATALDVNPINAARAAMLVPLTGLAWLWPRRPLRPLLVVIAVVGILAALATGSRGPLTMGLLTGVLMWLATGRGHARALRAVLAIAGGVLILMLPLSSLLGGLVPAFALARFARLGDTVRALLAGDAISGSDAARLDIWALAVRMSEARPLTGHGAGSFALATPEIGYPDITYPHNLLVQAAAEYGVIGLLVVGGVTAAVLRSALRPQIDPAATAIAAMAVFLVLCAMVSDDLADNRTMWGAVLLVLALPRHEAHPTTPCARKSEISVPTTSASSAVVTVSAS